MKFLVLLFLAFFSITVNAQNIIVDGDIFTGIKYDKNYVVNAEGEKSHKVGITSTMSTTSRTAVVADVISGQYSYELTAGAASQSFTVSSTALAAGLNGQTCEGSFSYRFNSLSIPFVANILSGTTVIASGTLTNTTGSTSATVRNVLTYPCVTGLKPSVQVTSTASSATKLYTDKYYTGAYVTSGGGITGVVTVAQGGTSLTTTVNNGLLVGSGTTQYRNLSPTASGAVVTLDENGNTNFLYPETNSVVNYLTNPSFEQSATGWVVSGAATVDRYDRSLQSVNYLKSDRYYGIIVAGPANTGACYTQTIPQSQRGSNIEIATKYRNGTNVSGTWLMQSTAGSQTVSQSLVMEAGTSTTPYTDQFLDSPTMTIGTTSSTATVQTCFTKTSGSVYFHYDNVWVGSLRSKISVNTGKLYGQLRYGGVSNCAWSANGSWITPAADTDCLTPVATGNLIAPSTKVLQATIPTLPAGIYRAKLLGIMIPQAGGAVFGRAQLAGIDGTEVTTGRNDSGGWLSLGPIIESLITIPTPQTNATLLFKFYGNTTIDATAIGTTITLERIDSVDVDLITTKCMNDISCNNVFTAKVNSSGVVSGEPLGIDWINGNAVVSDTSLFTMTIPNTIFPNGDQVCVSAYTGSDTVIGIRASVASVTSSTVVVRTGYTSTATSFTKAAMDFTISCTRSSDFVAKKDITGYLNQTMTTAGDRLYRTEIVKMTASCSTSPCPLSYKSSGITQVNFGGSGLYSISFAPGTFSDIPVCTFTAKTNNVVTFANSGGDSTASVNVLVYNPPSTLTSIGFDAVCTGPRP